VGSQIKCAIELGFIRPTPPIVIVPVKSWSWLARKAIRFSMTMTSDVYCVHVESEDGDPNPIELQWQQYVVRPAEAAGVKPPKLVRLPNPYRRLFGSLLDFIDRLKAENPNRKIAVIIPDLVEKRWYHYFLHNQRAVLLRAAIQLHGDPQVVVITVPWYLEA
jgi:hypothetical protein